MPRSKGEDPTQATRGNNALHTVCALFYKLFLRVDQLCQIFAYRTRQTLRVVTYFCGSLTYVRSSLTELNKSHEVCSKLFLRVAQLCQIFAYRTRRTKCVVSYFFGSLSYVTVFAYRTRHTKCAVSYFFGSLSYVRSSLTEQGARSV